MSKIFDNFCRDIRSTYNSKILLQDFSPKETDDARIDDLLSVDGVKLDIEKFASSTLTKGSKDETRANFYREFGGKYFMQKEFIKSLTNYTMCICYAEMHTTLATGYANRSAVLFRMKKYEASLQNIALALNNNYPDELRYKLYDRRGQCYLASKHRERAVNSFTQALECLPKSNLDDQRRKVWTGVLEQRLKSCSGLSDHLPNEKEELIEGCAEVNERFPSLSLACTVAFTEDAGRFIKASRDILPGEVVVVEKPYASVLMEAQKLEHCHHCTKYTASSIPSDCCSSVVFCDEGCKQKAQSYHKYECEVLPTLHKAEVGKFGLLALRCLSSTHGTVLTAARDDSSKVETCVGADNQCQLGCNPEGKYCADDYQTIYNLVGHSSNRSRNDILKKCILASYISVLLATHSTYNKDMSLTVSQAASILLRHLQSLPCNAHEISEFHLDKNDVATSTSVEVGAGIFSSLSLFNHSCDPTVTRNFTSGNTCIVRAIKTIRAGEQVSDNYGAVYATHTSDDRQRLLQDHYFFSCNCQPCAGKWPLYQNIPIKPSPKCQKCSVNDGRMDWNMSSYKCSECGEHNDFKTAFATLGKHQLSYMSAFENIILCNIGEAEKELLDYVAVLDKFVKLPYQPYNNCQEGLKQCFNMHGNTVDITQV